MQELLHRVHEAGFKDITFSIEEVNIGWYGLLIETPNGEGYTLGRRWSSYDAALRGSGEALDTLVRYWTTQLSDRSNAVVAEGVHYRIGKEDAPGSSQCRGYGGQGFQFVSLDGSQIVRSTNVWYQGVVPSFAAKRFPDTHRLLESVR